MFLERFKWESIAIFKFYEVVEKVPIRSVFFFYYKLDRKNS